MRTNKKTNGMKRRTVGQYGVEITVITESDAQIEKFLTACKNDNELNDAIELIHQKLLVHARACEMAMIETTKLS